MKEFVTFIALVISISGITHSREVPFEKCASPYGELDSVDVTPCDEEPCVVKRGTNVTIRVTFTPNEVVNSGKIHLYAIKWGRQQELPLKNPYACKGYGLACPLKKGITQTLSFTDTVPHDVPSVSLKLEATLVDENGDSVACGIIAVKVV